MIGAQLIPADTCFFGDGVPFSAFGPQEDVGGVFPPHPPTVVGALRAMLARSNGWDGRKRWPRALDAILGDGPDLGRFSMMGPVLLHDNQPLVPVPRHVVGMMQAGEPPGAAKRWHPKALLRPGPPMVCDLGDDVRLPHLPAGSLAPPEQPKVGEGWWLTRSGLREVLAGRVPAASEVLLSAALWAEERRVGLEREHKTRTAKEGMLYSARHIRLHAGVSLGVGIAGIPESWHWPWGTTIPLGGESRLSELAQWDGGVELPVSPPVLAELSGHGRLLVVALTPLDLDPKLGGDLGFPSSWGPVTLVAACIDRPQRVGGWSSLAHQPLALGSVVPAGSVLFCQVEHPQPLARVLANDKPPQLGARQAWGFGVIALGTWPEEPEDKSR
jgi:CRISPR-associated protein Cmr3